MRVLVVAVAGSVLAHVVALGFLVRDPVAEPIAIVDEPVTPTEQPPPVEDMPFEVVFLDTPTTNHDVSDVVVASMTRSTSAHFTGGRGSGTELSSGKPTGGSEGTGKHSPYMVMRDPNKKDLDGISGSFLSDFLNRSKELPPPANTPERVDDEIAELRSQLNRAGRYSPDELAAKRAELVALNEEKANQELKPAGGGSYKTEKETFRTKVNPDGTVKIEDKPENMDSQDKIMLEHGIDPYARNKLAYLDRTRDQRVEIGKRYHKEQLKKSVLYMQQHVARLWGMTKDVAKRKEGIFELWDECTEVGDPEDVAGGEAARAFALSYAKTLGYTPDEVAAFNAKRQSKQPFAP